MTAVAHPNAMQIIKVSLEKGFHVNSHNSYHETVLNVVIGCGDELVIYLLSQGARAPDHLMTHHYNEYRKVVVVALYYAELKDEFEITATCSLGSHVLRAHCISGGSGCLLAYVAGFAG